MFWDKKGEKELKNRNNGTTYAQHKVVYVRIVLTNQRE